MEEPHSQTVNDKKIEKYIHKYKLSRKLKKPLSLNIMKKEMTEKKTTLNLSYYIYFVTIRKDKKSFDSKSSKKISRNTRVTSLNQSDLTQMNSRVKSI